jgi:MFS family permease
MAIDPTAAAGLPDGIPPAPQRALRTPAFRGLLAGWTLTNVADSLLTLILAVWVTDLTGSAALGGATFVAFGLPSLASPLIGMLADRVSRRRLLAAAYLIGAAGLVPLFWVSRPDQVWIVYAATFLYALISYVTAACQSGILRDLLPDDALGPANARLSTIDQVLRIAGPIAGAAVYAWAGPLPIVAAAAVAFAGAAVVFASLRLTESEPDRADRDPFGRRLLAGFRHLFGTRPLSGMTWALVVAMAAAGLLNSVVFAMLEALGVPAGMLGPVNAAQGVAGIVAGLTAPALMRRTGRVRTYALGMTAVGVGILPLALPWLGAVVAGLALVGYGSTTLVIAYVTERQIATPERLQGRTATASHVSINLPQVVLTAVGSALVAVVDYRILIAVTTAVVLIMAVAAFRLRPHVGDGG